MAHFAELDSNNKVLRVLAVDNEHVPSDMHVDGETWCANNIVEDPSIAYVNGSYPGVAWKQTSLSGSFRRRHAGVGGYFVDDGGTGYFVAPKPHSDWVLQADGSWKEPVDFPSVISYTKDSVEYYYHIYWDQANTRWLATKVWGEENPYNRHPIADGAVAVDVNNPPADDTQVRVWNPASSSWS